MFGFLNRFLFSLAMSLSVLWPTSPWYYPFPSRDSGVFLYTGWRILNGEIPYIQIWDHKPPLIFLINTIGLGLSGMSFWGVWLVRVFSLCVAVYVIYLVLEKYFGGFIATLTSIVWVANLPPILGNGNFTTEYTIPLQAIAIYLTSLSLQNQDKSFLRYFLIGIVGGLAFMTKQTSIGIWLAIGIFLFIDALVSKKLKLNLIRFFGLAAGSLLPILLVISCFIIFQGLHSFWDQAFLYNFAYIDPQGVTLFQRFVSLINPAQLGNMGLFYLGGIGALVGIVLSINWFSQRKLTPLQGIILICLSDLVIEILLVHLPTHTYEHYYLTFFPVLAFFCAMFFSSLSKIDISNTQKNINQTRIFLILVAAFSSLSLFNTWGKSLTKPEYHINESLIKFVLNQTQPEDRLLIWGAETTINFYTKRAAPTRYVYQYALVTPGYTTEEKVLEFLDDILNEPPILFVDSNRPDMPFLKFAVSSDLIDQKVSEILRLYNSELVIGGWPVYTLAGSIP